MSTFAGHAIVDHRQHSHNVETAQVSAEQYVPASRRDVLECDVDTVHLQFETAVITGDQIHPVEYRAGKSNGSVAPRATIALCGPRRGTGTDAKRVAAPARYKRSTP